MEDRIEINGVWYIREDYLKPSNKEIVLNKEEITHIRSCVYETHKFCWKANILVKENDTRVNRYLDIEFTDKRIKPWKDDNWDSMSWFEGVIENRPESLKELDGIMDKEDIKIFQKFLEYLKNDLGWF